MKDETKDNQLRDDMLPQPSSRDLRGRQSVRATFKLTARAIETMSAVSIHLGIKQKSLFDHLVDDIKAQREIASQILTELGYQVHTACSGEAALEFLKSHHIDLLLLDIEEVEPQDRLLVRKKGYLDQLVVQVEAKAEPAPIPPGVLPPGGVPGLGGPGQRAVESRSAPGR